MKQGLILYHLTAIAVVIVWGSTFVFTKLLLQNGLSPTDIFTARFVIAYPMLLAISLLYGSHKWVANNIKDELLMLALGVTGGSLYFMTENAAMNYTTTTNTSLIVCMCPLFAALLISVFYKAERLRGWQIVGSLMAALGVVIVVLNGHFVLHLSPRGDALAFCACMCWSVYSLLLIPAGKCYNTLFITRKVFFYGLLTMAPYYILWSELPPIESLLRPDTLSYLLFLGCMASTVCYLLWNWVIQKLGAVVTTNYVYFNPVITILCAWVVLSESITLWFLLGTILIISGMFLSEHNRHIALHRDHTLSNKL